MQLLILKRQNNCREDLKEEQNGVEGKCMYTQNKEPVSEVEKLSFKIQTLTLDSHLLNSSYFGWPLI